MADLVEILSVEHLAIRHLVGNFRLSRFEELVRFDDYLVQSHIEIEEKILFPRLKRYEWDDGPSYTREVDRIAADHKLLNTLFSNIVSWHDEGKDELASKRLQLYFRLLQEHNDSEEKLIFPRWKSISSDERDEALEGAFKIIESRGIEQYLETVKFSENSFSYFFDRNRRKV